MATTRVSLIVPLPDEGANEVAADVICEACTRLQESDFRFSVDARGTAWDVYKVRIMNQDGLIAIRLIEGRVEIGYCRSGLAHSADEIASALNDQEN